VNQDGYDPLGPASIDAYENRQNTDRFLGSVQANYYPLSWLRITAWVGSTSSTARTSRTFRRGASSSTTRRPRATASRTRASSGRTRAAHGAATVPLNRSVTSTTTLSFQYQQERPRGVSAFGARLVAGTGQPRRRGRAVRGRRDGRGNKLVSGIFNQQFGYRDRLFLTAGVRGDDNSAFGQNFGTVYYPNAQISWVASEEAWFPKPAALSSFRLRSAFGPVRGCARGRSTRSPTFAPSPRGSTGSRPRRSRSAASAIPDLKPETTTEYEGGADVGLFGDRVNLQATYYSRVSEDALVQRVIAPSVGASRLRFENIGEVKNAGFEAQLTSRAVDVRNLQLDLTLNYSRNEAKIVSLAADVPEILLTANGSQRHRAGYAPGAYWGRRITGFTSDADGIVDEITYSDSAEFLGSSVPRTQFSVQPALTLFNFARVQALVDYRGGFKQFNASEEFRCGILARCRGLNDINTPVAEQANAFATYNDGVYAGYIEDADFVRLREVSLTLTAPQRLAQRVGANGLSLTLAGYNLGISTDYTGVDPEVNSSAQANFVQSDFLSQAPIRRFSARFNLTF
jgi:hypothetical protein